MEPPRAAGLRVAVGAAGTAGHVIPALAVASTLRDWGAEVYFLGGRRAERSLVPRYGFPFHQIPTGGLDRRNPLRAGTGLLRAAIGVGAASRQLHARRPDVFFGAGGYVVVSGGFAALALRVPIVLLEADRRLGLANRLLAPFARRVCLAFPIPGREGGPYLVCGRPLLHQPPARGQARAALGLDPEERFVLVFGGSLGARSLNEAALEALRALPARVVHLCGAREYGRLAGAPLPPTYTLKPFVPPAELSTALAAADLVVARAGGSALEVAAHGAPMVLVPYPAAAADHQRANARFLAAAGAAAVVEDKRLAKELGTVVRELLEDRPRREAMAQAARRLVDRAGAKRVAQAVVEAARR